MSERHTRRLHTLVVDDADRAVAAVSSLRSEGYHIYDVHTPFPVHGMSEAMGLRESRVSIATLAGAGVGVLAGLGLQIWTSAWDWPLNIGGKSDLAFPALVPVTFELAILAAAIATVAALVIRSRLCPLGHTPRTQPHQAVSDNRFVILVEETDGEFDPKAFWARVRALEIDEYTEAWRVS